MGAIEQAIVLAAGEGQRLRPFTALKPKVMLPIANRPILSYVLDAAAKNGIHSVIIVVGYHKEQVQDYFGSGEQFGFDITYVTQPQQIGTGHALKSADRNAAPSFLVLPGDNIIEPGTIASIVKSDSPSMLVRRSDNASKYGVVDVDGGYVRNIEEKPVNARSNLVNTGIYVLNRDVFKFLENEPDLTVALQNMINSGLSVQARETNAPWLDVIYPWDILALNSAAVSNIKPATTGVVEAGCTIKGPVRIGQGTIIRSNSYLVGPVIIGQGCEIGPNVCLSPSSSIGDNVTISPFSYIRNSVISSHVQIGPQASIQNTVIGSHTTLGGRFTARNGEATVRVENEFHRVTIGPMIGDYCNIEDGVVVQPGTLVGNYTHIRSLKVVSENTIDRSLIA